MFVIKLKTYIDDIHRNNSQYSSPCESQAIMFWGILCAYVVQYTYNLRMHTI
jgi:hypothetical protein